jgi:predicted kinase
MKNTLLKWFSKNEPELEKEMKDIKHGYNNSFDNPYHLEGSIWAHTNMVLDEVEKYYIGDYVLMISALLHDIGKVKTYKDNPNNNRRSFAGHEAISVFIASDILKKLSKSWGYTELLPYEETQILKIIGLHGRLYDYIGKEEKIKDAAVMFENDSCTLEYLKKFYACDHMGRITDSSIETYSILEVNEWFYKVLGFIAMQKYDETKIIPDKEITVLVGLPRSGKSTYCKTLKNVDDIVVISRDNILMEYAKDGETYSEVWKKLTDEDQKNIDKELQKRYNTAIKSGDNIIIDMTNMSKKSRKKWLANARGYFKKCVVFPTGIDTCNSRNTPDKNIPLEILESMAKRFVVPLYDEFHFITWED